MTPILALERVHARDAAGRDGRARGSLIGVSITLGPGTHAFLGTPTDGTLALIDACTGARAPVRGRVTIAGHAPARTPALRARIGALVSSPRIPAAPTVRDAVHLAMRARGEPGHRADAVLDPLGLSPLAARDPRALSFAELRAVELALALSTPAPVLLALHEPLCDVAIARLDALQLRLREAAASGTCVVVTTSSPADARALADHVLVLHQGTVARETGGENLAAGDGTTLRAWVRAGARELGAALTLRPEVRAVSWKEGSGGASSVVEVRGDRAEDCSLAIIESALAVDAQIEAMTEAAPTLGQVRSTTEDLWAALRKRPAPDPEPAPAEQPAPAEEAAAPAEEPAAPPEPDPAATSPEEQRSAP